ncbi:PRK06851 family protein [Tepidibacter formicigenes]|uniref:ATPase n=1 Tax=Tepidibacter formicigenes DSM 15518 TaxID=1123349 RepID=A0A1M6MFZ1_9FIRM|nr:PRK06851 family protein [Tepidibacter formicigenes]SHJ82384.1 hypothetical protein SAMN02744037_00928 [Tepidibacter formicigenes DSM 15518]
MAANLKRVFPGGNTSEGFYSYYDYLIENDANRIFVIKGGPGVGKSSMMKRIGHEMIKRGYDVEFHHCSSDNNSIDGIVIPKLRVAMVDGTAPHIVDPKNPGAVDEIIHLGDYWDLEKMKGNREEILKSNKEVGRLFQRAYKFLRACRPIAEDIVNKYKEAMDFGKVNVQTINLINKIFENITTEPKIGKERHLFGSAITPNGHIEYTDTILNNIGKIYHVKGNMGTGKSTLLEKIYKQALLKGLDVEVYHTPLIPQKIETILIKDINIALTISKMYEQNNYKIIDLDKYIDNKIISKYKEELDYDKKMLNDLLQQGILNINRAKKEHDIMETYYIPNMKFEEIEKRKNEILKRILSYEK